MILQEYFLYYLKLPKCYIKWPWECLRNVRTCTTSSLEIKQEKNYRKAAFIEQGLREPMLTLNSLCSQGWFWTPDPPVPGSHVLGWQMYNVNSSFGIPFNKDGKWNTRLPWVYFSTFYSQRSLFWFSKRSIITVPVCHSSFCFSFSLVLEFPCLSLSNYIVYFLFVCSLCLSKTLVFLPDVSTNYSHFRKGTENAKPKPRTFIINQAEE